VLHVVTVHWQDDRWIEPQLRFLRRNLPPEHRVYASLNGIDPSFDASFFSASDLEGGHADKLNALAAVVAEQAHRDDLLMFLDGDAFPIAPIGRSLLGGTELAAVRRDENLGDRQPHPSFCLTTVGFWSDIDGDWRRGYEWTSATGDQVTDVGGNLLGILTAGEIPWRPLLRSNRFDLDPLWFAIYGDVVYHHGAGFRPPLARRVDLQGRQVVRAAPAQARTPEWVPVLGRAERSARYRIAQRRHRHDLAQHADDGQRLSDEVFGWIRDDDEFFRRFQLPADEQDSRAT
jgi:hypothetical protein